MGLFEGRPFLRVQQAFTITLAEARQTLLDPRDS